MDVKSLGFSIFVHPKSVWCVCVCKPTPVAILYQYLNACVVFLINGTKDKDMPDFVRLLQYEAAFHLINLFYICNVIQPYSLCIVTDKRL